MPFWFVNKLKQASYQSVGEVGQGSHRHLEYDITSIPVTFLRECALGISSKVAVQASSSYAFWLGLFREILISSTKIVVCASLSLTLWFIMGLQLLLLRLLDSRQTALLPRRWRPHHSLPSL